MMSATSEANDRSERNSDDDAYGEIDDIASKRKFFEVLKHDFASLK